MSPVMLALYIFTSSASEDIWKEAWCLQGWFYKNIFEIFFLAGWLKEKKQKPFIMDPKGTLAQILLDVEAFQIGISNTKTLGKEITFVLFVYLFEVPPPFFSSFVLAASCYVTLSD